MVSDGRAGASGDAQPGDGPQENGTPLDGWLRLTLGLLAVVVGAVWTVQGLGYVDGSVLTGQRIWAILGPLLILVGLALLWLGTRARSRR
ncbi:hypothetical protein [Micromonospora sp. HNM0581]|uniref:hypothetical protein n=1 Tax=Micromonospora sp. HNM0581 TaxID=2716341 RepID=UPI001F0D81C5|nr:hypothetical protein [Micromonospora sp. HNM0581]